MNRIYAEPPEKFRGAGPRGTTHARMAGMNIIRQYGMPAMTAGLLFACGAANQGAPVAGSRETQTGVTASQSQTDVAVVDRMSSARCDQEQECKNIGPDAKYASRSVCMDQIRGAIGNDLTAYECRRGLDHDAVDRCMAAIKSEECSHPFETLSRYEKCRTGAICMK
jgi:Family of unknown function (DUF6184)